MYYGLNAYGRVIHSTSNRIAAFLLTKYSNNNYDLRKFTTRYNLTAFYDYFRLYLKQGVKMSKIISFNSKAGNTSVHISFEIKKVKIDYYSFSFPNKDGATIKDVTVAIPVRITPYKGKHYWCNVKLNVGDMFINDCYDTYKNSVASSITGIGNNFPQSAYVDASQNSSGKWIYAYK